MSLPIYLKLYFNPMLISMPRFSLWDLSFRPSHQTTLRSSSVRHSCHVLRPFQSYRYDSGMNVRHSANILSYKDVVNGKNLQPKNGTKRTQLLRFVKKKDIQNGVHQEICHFFLHRGFIKSCDRLVNFKSEVNNHEFCFTL
jgi:hypothetical protein